MRRAELVSSCAATDYCACWFVLDLFKARDLKHTIATALKHVKSFLITVYSQIQIEKVKRR